MNSNAVATLPQMASPAVSAARKRTCPPSGCGPYQSVTMFGAAKAAQASMPHMPPPAWTAMASSGSSICSDGSAVGSS